MQPIISTDPAAKRRPAGHAAPREAGHSSTLMYLDPAALRQHPEAAKIPQLPEGEVEAIAESIRRNGFDPAYPLKLSLDAKHVLDGEGRRRAAIVAGVNEVPCVSMRVGEDEQEAILAASLLRRQLTDDQRAVLAYRYQQRLSELRNVEKGRKGARKRKGEVDPSEIDRLQAAENSRKEAAANFRVAENKLKTLAAIEMYEREQSIKPEDSVIPKVLAGSLDLGKASDPARLAKEQAARKEAEEKQAAQLEETKKREAMRRSRIEALPDIASIQMGDPLTVLRRQFKGDELKPKIDLLILQTFEPSDVRRILDEAVSAVAETWGCYVITDFANEAVIVREMTQSKLHVLRLIWDFDPNEERTPDGKSHLSILWGAQGRTLAKMKGGDVIRSSSHDGQPREELWSILFKLAAKENDFVFCPLAADARASIQAIRSKLHPVTVVPEAKFIDAREEFERSTRPDKWFEELRQQTLPPAAEVVIVPAPSQEVQSAKAI